jgi:hypothetical protein
VMCLSGKPAFIKIKTIWKNIRIWISANRNPYVIRNGTIREANITPILRDDGFFRLYINLIKYLLTTFYPWLHSNIGLCPEIHPCDTVARRWGMPAQQKHVANLQHLLWRDADHLPRL